MTTLLVAIATVAALVLWLATLRIELVATLHHDGGTQTSGVITALFGWVRVPFRRTEGAREALKPESLLSAWTGWRDDHASLRDRLRLAELLIEVLSRISRRVHLYELKGDVLFGFDDPADTGELWGMLGTLAVLAQERHPRLSVRPVFNDAMLFIDGMIRVGFRPLWVLATVAAAAARPARLALLFRMATKR